MLTVHSGRRFGAAILIAAALALPPCALAQEIRIETTRQGEFIVVSASATVKADQRLAWEVLSDYDHFPKFIPDLISSRVVQRSADGILVEQKGEISFLFFKQPVEMTLAITEQPPMHMLVRGVSGSMKDLESSYELRSSAEGVQINYAGRFIPDSSVPPLIGMPFVRSLIARRFRAMIAEIERRAALAHSGKAEK